MPHSNQLDGRFLLFSIKHRSAHLSSRRNLSQRLVHVQLCDDKQPKRPLAPVLIEFLEQ